MRNGIIGVIIGIVLGIVLGATVIAPRLDRPSGESARPVAEPAVEPPADVARHLQRALISRPSLSIKLQSAFKSDVPVAGELGKRLDTLAWEISRGQVEIRFAEPDTLAPVADLLDAVAAGTLDAAFAPATIWGGKLPAMWLYGGVPFGPSALEFLSWYGLGDGQALFNRITNANGVHGVLCGLLPPAVAGWFRRELFAPEDLQGLRISASGLTGKVLRELGAQPVEAPAENLAKLAERGLIDGIVHAMPAIDVRLGFYKSLRNVYFPAWHQPTLPLFLFVNRDKWKRMSSVERAQLDLVCGDNVRFGLTNGDAAQLRALREIQAAGLRVQPWSPAMKAALAGAWKTVVDAEAKSNVDFRAVWKSLNAFRDEYAVWAEIGGL